MMSGESSTPPSSPRDPEPPDLESPPSSPGDPRNERRTSKRGGVVGARGRAITVQKPSGYPARAQPSSNPSLAPGPASASKPASDLTSPATGVAANPWFSKASNDSSCESDGGSSGRSSSSSKGRLEEKCMQLQAENIVLRRHLEEMKLKESEQDEANHRQYKELLDTYKSSSPRISDVADIDFAQFEEVLVKYQERMQHIKQMRLEQERNSKVDAQQYEHVLAAYGKERQRRHSRDVEYEEIQKEMHNLRNQQVLKEQNEKMKYDEMLKKYNEERVRRSSRDHEYLEVQQELKKLNARKEEEERRADEHYDAIMKSYQQERVRRRSKDVEYSSLQAQLEAERSKHEQEMVQVLLVKAETEQQLALFRRATEASEREVKALQMKLQQLQDAR